MSGVANPGQQLILVVDLSLDSWGSIRISKCWPLKLNMATRKKTLPEVKAPDALIIPKASFLAKLLERIELGQELIKRPITNVEELEQNSKDFYKWNDYNSEYLKQSFNNEHSEYKTNYDRVNQLFGFGDAVYDNSPQKKLRDLKEKIQNKVSYLEKLIDKTELLKSEVEDVYEKVEQIPSVEIDNNNIFIVHGHNIEILQSVARAIEKLGLNPIILHEKANAGKTIIEKFEANSKVGFAIILLTDDDEGKSKLDIDLKRRARQNVVLELGYFIGKLGRNRVLPLYSDGVEVPSDIHGLLYVPIDNSGNWKFSLVKELKAANYNVDANKLL